MSSEPAEDGAGTDVGEAGAFDELIHAPKRLRICALLGSTAAVEFATLRDAIDVSDSVLSKHLSVLEAAGYVATHRETRASRQRLWASLTPAGRRSYAAHVRALRRIVGLE